MRHHLRESGGDKLVMELLDKGSIYVGSSAGSIVGGRTIQMAFWKNWDDKTAEGTISVDWNNPDLARGLDIGGGRSFFPHANGQYANKQWQPTTFMNNVSALHQSELDEFCIFPTPF